MENSQPPLLLLVAKRKEAVVRDKNRTTTAERRAQKYYRSFVLVREEAYAIVLCADVAARLEMHFIMTAVVLPIFTRATISKNNTTINQQQSQGRGGRRPSTCCTGIGRQQQQLRTRPSNIISRSCSFVRRRHQCHRIIIFLVVGDSRKIVQQLLISSRKNHPTSPPSATINVQSTAYHLPRHRPHQTHFWILELLKQRTQQLTWHRKS
jgi:hypothetical protein